MDPDHFELIKMRENLSDRKVLELGIRGAIDAVHQRTGRTYRMLFNAFEAITRGERVGIVAWSEPYAHELAHTLVEWVRQVRIKGDLIEARSHSQHRQQRSDDGIHWFYDHRMEPTT